MDRFLKRGLKIFAALAAFVILIGIIMLVANATATGKAGQSKTGIGVDASMNGWGVILVGLLLIAVAFFSIPKSGDH